MACDRFNLALREHALGAPLDPLAAAHLAVCERCQDHLAHERELAQLIEAGIVSVGAEEPPADFRVRLVERLVATRAPVRNRWTWRMVTAGAVAAAMVVAAVVNVFVPRGSHRRDPARPEPAVAGATLPAETSEAVAAPAPAVSTQPDTPPRQAASRPPVAPVLRARTRSRPAFDVLVPAGQRESLARLAVSLSQHDPRVATRLLGRATDAREAIVGDDAASGPVNAALIVTSLKIEPVVVPELAGPRALIDNED